MRTRPSSYLAIPALLVALLGGCSGLTDGGGNDSKAPVDDGESAQATSSAEWASKYCAVALETSTTGNIFALTQAPLSPDPAAFPTEERSVLLGLYSIDENSGTATLESQMSADSVFCYEAGAAAETVEAVEEVSGEVQEFSPVETPDGPMYIVDYAGFESNPAGLRFNASSMNIENEKSGNVPYTVSPTITVSEDDLTKATPAEVDPCDLNGSLCV